MINSERELQTVDERYVMSSLSTLMLGCNLFFSSSWALIAMLNIQVLFFAIGGYLSMYACLVLWTWLAWMDVWLLRLCWKTTSIRTGEDCFSVLREDPFFWVIPILQRLKWHKLISFEAASRNAQRDGKHGLTMPYPECDMCCSRFHVCHGDFPFKGYEWLWVHL